MADAGQGGACNRLVDLDGNRDPAMSLIRRWLGRHVLRGGGRDLEATGIRAGARFARMNAAQVVESAEVLAVERQAGDVPHVRYRCLLHRDNKIFDTGPRTLSLYAFLRRFQDPAHG
jgi:hypothetical protein